MGTFVTGHLLSILLLLPVAGRTGEVPRTRAALLAAAIVGLGDAKIMAKVERYRERQSAAVAEVPSDEPQAAHR